jgi:hypothetical protein
MSLFSLENNPLLSVADFTWLSQKNALCIIALSTPTSALPFEGWGALNMAFWVFWIEQTRKESEPFNLTHSPANSCSYILKGYPTFIVNQAVMQDAA